MLFTGSELRTTLCKLINKRKNFILNSQNNISIATAIANVSKCFGFLAIIKKFLIPNIPYAVAIFLW